MKPAAFSYHRPASIDETLALLAEAGADAKLVAGGQSLGPMMNMRLASPAQLIDINDLSELAYVRTTADGIEVGGLTRHFELAESPAVRQQCPLLAQAARTIGHYAIRQRGSLAGSLAHADPAAQHVLVAVTLGARLTLARRGSQRVVDAREFFLAAMTTALAPDEIILSVTFPRFEADEASAFRLFNRRHGDYAIVAVAATLALREGRVARLRLGVSGVAPVPQRLDALEREFQGQPPTPAWVEQVARAARSAVQPEDDPRVPAVYRQELTEVLVSRALARSVQRLEEASA